MNYRFRGASSVPREQSFLESPIRKRHIENYAVTSRRNMHLPPLAAVVGLAQHAAILPRDTDRIAPLLGMSGVIDHQDPSLAPIVGHALHHVVMNTARYRFIRPHRVAHEGATATGVWCLALTVCGPTCAAIGSTLFLLSGNICPVQYSRIDASRLACPSTSHGTASTGKHQISSSTWRHLTHNLRRSP